MPPDDFDEFASRFAAPFLGQQFGPRDKNGNLQPLLYRGPGSADPVEISGVLLTKITGGLEQTENGDIEGRQRIEAKVEAAQLRAAGITGLVYNATLEVEGELWAIDLAQSNWGNVYVEFSLVRNPLHSMRRYERDASV